MDSPSHHPQNSQPAPWHQPGQAPQVNPLGTRPFAADSLASVAATDQPDRLGVDLLTLDLFQTGNPPPPSIPPTIQRDPTPPTPTTPAADPNEITNQTFDTSKVEVTGWETKTPDQVEAITDGPLIKLKAPLFKLKGTVGLKTGLKMASAARVDVGPVQSLVSSDRIGVYRKGGLPNGDVTSEQHDHKAKMRDALGGLDKSGQARNSAYYAPPPWYSTPSAINSSISEVEVRLEDQPVCPLTPEDDQGGILTEAKGQDSFLAAMAAKVDGQDKIIFLKSQRWSVPWNMQIQSGSGTGGAVTNAATQENPADLTGDPANLQSGTSWISFPTLGAAMAASAAVIMSNLAAVKANDPPSWTHSIEALRRKNPIFNLQIRAKKTAKYFGDKFTVQVTGSKSAQMADLELNNRVDVNSATAIFGLNEVFDIASIDSGSNLKIELLPLGKSATWSYPFLSSGTAMAMKGGKGDYEVTCSLK